MKKKQRLSIVMEWANTRLHGVLRAEQVIERITGQWASIGRGELPGSLSAEARSLLAGLDPRGDLVIVTGEPARPSIDPALAERASRHFDFMVHVAEGLEYYPLKNEGASLVEGDYLLFVDSDVLPEPEWLAHLIGSFARPEIDVVCGQTYVAPTDLVARAFALGWTYQLRDETGRLLKPRRFYANNIAFRAAVFRETGFRSVGKRSRGASGLLRRDLDRVGIPIWENRMARTDHPPPLSLGHLVERALAHGRDHYMQDSEARHFGGLARSLGIAAKRLGRGFRRTFRHWRQVGLKPHEVPAALAIISTYYGWFALGGVLTHVSPDAMARRFRV